MSIIAKGKFRLTWAQRQEWPADAVCDVCRDDGAGGAIDWDSPVNARPIPAWPDLAGKAGAGAGRLGAGQLGVGEGGYALGSGALGAGLLGMGAGFLSLTSPPLDDGDYTAGVVVADGAGNEVSPAPVTAPVAVAGSPLEIPSAPTASMAGGVVTLTWPLSPDDDA